MAILGVGMWQPTFPNAPSWLGGTPDEAAQKPLGQALDRVNRRRAGQLGRALADVAAEAIAMAKVDGGTIATIVGSAIGEAATMIGLLDQMWRHQQPMSPADFTVSVHNAASGLISIANKNRGMTTSIAADENTPAAALMEAIGLVVTTDQPVLLACADEPAPENLAGQAPPWAMLASALVVGPVARRDQLATLEVAHGPTPTLRPDRFTPLAVANPQIGLAWLVDAVLRGHSGIVPLDAGTGRGYVAELTATPR
ncbi:MAG: beta-ketoacyl synthase chain length factor [Planctomycetes bacterium]|nr:beta-ketoacyl synthase chain length factor [Planctomycetota bacterium]